MDSLHEESEARYLNQYGVTHRTTYLRNPTLATSRYEPVYELVAAEFRRKGCSSLSALRGSQPCYPESIEAFDRSARAAAAYHLLGDDMDGAAAMLEDFEALE